MLQENQTVLRDELQQTVKPDENLCQQILNMGFDIELVRNALKNSTNDMQMAIDSLLKMQADGTYNSILKNVLDNLAQTDTTPSTSAPMSSELPSTSQAAQNLKDEMQVSS